MALPQIQKKADFSYILFPDAKVKMTEGTIWTPRKKIPYLNHIFKVN